MSTDDVAGPGDWKPTQGGWSWICVAQLVPITIAVLRAVTGWVRKRMKKCKKWPWPLDWLCTFFWGLVLVVVGFVVVLLTVLITIYVCGWKRTDDEAEASETTSTGRSFSERVIHSVRGKEE